MDQLERNPERWKETYLFGRKMRINSGMAFGKKMADGLEDGDLSGDPVLDIVMERLPKFEIMDKVVEDPKGVWVNYFDPKLKKTVRIQVPALKDGKRKIPILAKLDTMKADGSAFKEYKTGQEPWTQKKADQSGQVTFYSATLFIKNGKIPADIELDYVQTAKGINGPLDARIGATGDIRRFHTVRHMGEVLNMMVRMKKAWEKIEKITEEELL